MVGGSMRESESAIEKPRGSYSSSLAPAPSLPSAFPKTVALITVTPLKSYTTLGAAARHLT